MQIPNTIIAEWTSTPNDGVWVIFILAMIAFAVIYAIPTVIAFARGHEHRWPIFLLNLAFGATFIGWLAVLLWSLGKIGSNKEQAHRKEDE